MNELIADLKTVYSDKVTERLALHPTDWFGEDSAKVVETYITNMRDDKGEPVVLSEFEKDVINVVSRPTFDVQFRIIKSIIEAHGARFDAATEKRIKDIVNATVFKKKLIENGLIRFPKADDLLS